MMEMWIAAAGWAAAVFLAGLLVGKESAGGRLRRRRRTQRRERPLEAEEEEALLQDVYKRQSSHRAKSRWNWWTKCGGE